MPELTANTHTELFLKAIAEGSTSPEGLVPENHLELWLQQIMEMGGVSGNYVRYTEQELSAAEEAQARDNIGAAGMEDLAPAYDSTIPYKVGNLLTYLGKQYYCIADAPAGTLPTNTAYFEEKSVADIIEMIKNGSIVTGHSEVADNLTPYSEDSGTTQENPFISQGTGTDNNSVIVTTGVIARQLEKQGNTVAKNQQVQNPTFITTENWTGNQTNVSVSNNELKASVQADSSTTTVRTTYYMNIPKGHICLVMFNAHNDTDTLTGSVNIGTQGDAGAGTPVNFTTTKTRFYKIVTTNQDCTCIRVYMPHATVGAIYTFSEFYCIDLTQWGFSSDIITDLTSHPEHFSWYYNGSMAFDAGSLQNCNGRYLECGQGRNLYNGVIVGSKRWVDGEYVNGGTDFASTPTKTMVVPNRTYCLTMTKLVANANAYVFMFDNNDNYLGSLSAPIPITTTDKHCTFTVLPNAYYVAITLYRDSPRFTSQDELSAIDISLYYTPEEGGEGYNQHYDYVAPIRIDTGNEVLRSAGSVKDVKLPSGVITRNVGSYTFTGEETFYSYNTAYYFSQSLLPGIKAGTSNIVGSNVQNVSTAGAVVDKTGIFVHPTNGSVYIHYSAAEMAGQTIYFEITTTTTEQGTPFSEYAPINDYSYMAWFDNDGNLVSIPQGCKLFYPVDYKGFTDDLVMYTNGDATALAKNEDITDTALNARGYYKMQDLLSPLTDAAGLTYDIEEAMKIGNLVSLTIRATNLEETSISSGDPLFTLASDLIPAGTIKAYANVAGSVVSCTISNLGSVSVDAAIAQNETVAIILTYAV